MIKAKDGCMVIGLDEARIVMDALSGAPLEFGDLEAIARLKIRIRESIARHEKTRILREIQPEYGIVEPEWWEVKVME